MYIGVDYYPEHWPQERWETDARLMREAGFNIVRLAEFAWIDFEREEGRYEFDWLDKALEILGRNGIAAILGTPTAAMPAWVAHKYPEVMAMEKNGERLAWGVRKNNCFSTPVYRRLSQSITRAMATHFAANPAIIGWQTDNEFGGPVCYCEMCRAAFQNWLRGRHGSLDELNRAWGTHFWGEKYTAWEEIVLPTDDSTYNPSLLLDFKRFNSWQNVTFQAEQVAILRQVCPGHFVTHNFMGLFSELNYYDLAKDLDFVSWDNYPVGGKPDIPTYASGAADIMRGLKRQNFWIMETTAGPAGWGAMGRNPRPGEIRKVALQQVAHGCDNLIWFRWRTCTAGREQYWHGLLGHDGVPRRRYQEAAQTAAEMRKLEPALSGTTVKADVAIVYDYESNWAFNFQPAYAAKPTGWESGWWGQNYTQAVERYYNALFRKGVNVDMIPPTADFSAYKVVIAPHLYILQDETAKRLNDYVAKGGVLLTDCRTGVKDETSLCYDRPLPGLLSEMLGILIGEYESIADGAEYTFSAKGNLSGIYTAGRFADWIIPQRAESLGEFRPWHMQGFAPVTRNRFGLGWGYYCGVIVKEPGFYQRLIEEVLEEAGVPMMALPEGVEASRRVGDVGGLLFLINHLETEQTVSVPDGAYDLLSGKKTGSRLTLERYGIAVLKI
jgi:beta-galactosidase